MTILATEKSSCSPSSTRRQIRGEKAMRRGLQGEDAACAALIAQGWHILGRRVQTQAGEVDAIAEKDGLLAIIEVKARPSLVEAAYALGARQIHRILAAAEILLGENPGWGSAGVRFDLMLVDRRGDVRRICDAFRLENA